MWLALGVAVPVLGSACSTSEASDYTYSCGARPLLQLSLLDVSPSGRERSILGERLNAIQVDAERVADCDGELVVVAWGGSASTSQVLFANPIRTTGASEIGRDRRIPEAVNLVMDEIRGSLNNLLPVTRPGGHDLLAAFSIISDFVRSRSGQSLDLGVHVYADGIATTGSALINVPGLTEDRVDEIVAEQSMPDLKGITVEMFGIGRLGGDVRPPQQVVESTLYYAQALCEATGAACSTFSSTFSTD